MVGLLKDRLPAPIAGQIHGAISGSGSGSGSGDGGGSPMDRVGDMFGGNG